MSLGGKANKRHLKIFSYQRDRECICQPKISQGKSSKSSGRLVSVSSAGWGSTLLCCPWGTKKPFRYIPTEATGEQKTSPQN